MKDFVMSDERKDILGHNHVVVGGFENRPEQGKTIYKSQRISETHIGQIGTIGKGIASYP